MSNAMCWRPYLSATPLLNLNRGVTYKDDCRSFDGKGSQSLEGQIMRQHRWLATSVGLALLLTTAASTTYAQSDGQQGNNNDHQDHGRPWWCQYVPTLPAC